MLRLDRRFDSRVPLEMFLNAYVAERPHRGFTANVSETGLLLNTLPSESLPPRTPVGLEFTLPGMPECIWAAGEISHESVEDPYFFGRGIRFVTMASLHARMIREYLYRARRLRLLRPRV